MWESRNTAHQLLYLPECTAGVYAALEDEGEHAGPVRIFLNKQIQTKKTFLKCLIVPHKITRQQKPNNMFVNCLLSL